MPSQEESFVGLFIDWDNLAISTAVDMAGAVPDVRAVVKAAQKFGTVLVARAYAEWNVSSERLSVYRAGIDPVYAPTFRFESESSAAGSKGKSLADPCLVTDCIDTLHLMPEITVFVLVSGDKDLIPIVRLAQLRGKKVAVIGPDFAAAILRDMADEYIPYRQLAESSENPPTEVSLHGVRSHRRVGPTVRANAAPATVVGRSSPPSRSTPLAVAPSPVPPEPNGSDVRHESTPIADTVTVAEVVVPSPAEEVLDPAPLYTVIGTILREREQAGKARLRATNLKDQLLARIPGFNERKYGFQRFKDLLTAAEKAGVLMVSRTGPVQWVTAVGSPAPTTVEAAPVAEVPVVPATETVEAPAAPTGEVDAEVVKFILGLRERSRWLTYTYVLTNLLNHLGNGAADAASDAEARVTLNRLVQAGVLVVDREPREIDVNGTRHRVRLCHVVDDHPLVQQAMAELKAATPESVPTESVTAAEEPSVVAYPTEVSEHSNGEVSPEVTVSLAVPTAPIVEPIEPEPEVALEALLETIAAESEATPQPEEPGQSQEEEAFTASASVSAEQPPAEAAPDAVRDETVRDEASAPVAPEANGHAEATPNGTDSKTDEPAAVPSLTLAESFAILREVVRDATDASRPTTGPAAVKNRLVRKLGAFDERAFGFSKFKDYLLSAERAGAIRLELSGTTTRVALAASEEASTPE